MKKPNSKFGLAALVSQPAPSTANNSVDALLFAPASNQVEPLPAPVPPIKRPGSTKTRFTNIIPTATYVQLHQLAFWDRRDMSEIIDIALKEYFANRPDANRPLPETERTKRKLPPYEV